METFTGLRMRQFERSLKVVRERGGSGPGGGRPWCLPLADRVLLVAVYYRTNLTMRQLAPLFGCSPATVCRVIQRLRPLLAIEPAARPADTVERLWIVDGTLIPVRDRTTGASSRNYRFSANVQVIIDADTRLVIAAARPVPGNTADAKAWRDSGLATTCAGATVLADGAYINTGLVVPHRKRPGRALLPGEEEDNAEDRDHVLKAVAAFDRTYGTKFPKAVKKITDDVDELLAFYDFPAEHWIHLRTTNPIESTFATVRLRTKVTKGAGSAAAALAMVFKLVESAQARWRAVNAPHLVALVRAGARFERGQPIERTEGLAA
ncbi:hypothetical protein RKD22_006233 [Streptomyces pristinaespiralis]